MCLGEIMSIRSCRRIKTKLQEIYILWGKIKMKRIAICLAVMITFVVLFSGCSLAQTEKGDSDYEISKIESIPFLKNQLYAVAYLGYDEVNELSFYVQNYLDRENIPIHYLSQGEYYLVIPRYSNMTVSLYKNDIQTMDSSLLFEEKECRPFIIQCNVSDIFSDATICLTYNGETVEFSPFISLKDGNVVVGDRGINITK